MHDCVTLAGPSNRRLNDRFMKTKKIILYANTAWYLFNFRLALALALKQKGYQVVLLAPYDQYVPKLEAHGFKVITVKMDRMNLNPFTELVLLFSLWTIFRREAPEIVFNFTVKCAVYGSLVARLAGIRRRINAVAGLGTVFSSQKRAMVLLRYGVVGLLKLALSGQWSRVILQNPDDAKLFIEQLGIAKDKITLIKGSGVNGVTFAEMEAARQQPWPPAPAKVLFASRLLWDKGIGDFVKAAQALAEGQHYRFLIAGEPDTGNPNAVSPEQLEQWAASGAVSLLGHIDNMAELLKEVDLVVLPSVYGEGVPRILIESAASGLPLIAFDVPGSREIVLNNENGFLLDAKQADTLAAHIAQIFADKARYQAMSKRSRQHFLQEFEESSVIKKTLEVIAGSQNTVKVQRGLQEISSK